MPFGVRQVTFFVCARAFDQPLAESIDRLEVGPHAFEHDLPADVDHVAVAQAVLVHDRRHLMREPSSPRWVCAQKMLTCEVARSSRITSGMPVNGRGA